jgi:hypothetical protein
MNNRKCNLRKATKYAATLKELNYTCYIQLIVDLATFFGISQVELYLLHSTPSALGRTFYCLQVSSESIYIW